MVEYDLNIEITATATINGVVVPVKVENVTIGNVVIPNVNVS